MIVDVSTPWGPFHHTRGHNMTSSLFFIFSHALTLFQTPSHSPCFSPFCRPISSLSPLTTIIRGALLTGSSHLFVLVWHREEVCRPLFLDLDEMRIACRMWKRSGTNGWNGPKANHPGRNHIGLAAGAASVVASACSCRSPWVFVLGLGPGPRLPGLPGEWAPRLSPRVTRAVYCLCATCLCVCAACWHWLAVVWLAGCVLCGMVVCLPR